MTHDFLSIIVPTSQGRIPWSLLHSIKEQSLDSNKYEIILVFNKKNPPANVVPWSNVRFLFSPFRGVNHARNLGIVHALGSVLLFLDDDCILQNTRHLETLLELHNQHPQQKSIGGPYTLSKKSSAAARAYHWNRTRWLKTHSLGQWHSQVLLGGNASYKSEIFKAGLRFSPGITYGGSETPLNVEIYHKYGPHLFLEDMAVEHASRLSVMSFLKKAYLQGKGWAFQQKFHSDAIAKDKTPVPRASWCTHALIYLYNLLFMIGYRTSIFERRFWLWSAIEEVSKKLLRPLETAWSDGRLAHHVATTEYFPFLPAPQKRSTVTIAAHESLYEKLKSVSKQEFQDSSFGLNPSLDPGRVFTDLLRISQFFSFPPETLSFMPQSSQEGQLLIHDLPQGVVIFDPAVSDNFKSWSKQRLEISKLKSPVYYLSCEDKVLAKKVWPHVKKSNFFPLDNVFVDATVWKQYLNSSTNPYNHFSWNLYLHKNPISALYNNAKIGQPLKLDTLCLHARTHFLNSPQRAFYQTNYVLLGTHWKKRSLLLKLTLAFSAMLNWIPKDFKKSSEQLMQSWQLKINHWNIEAQETSSLLYKWTAYALHRLYWAGHRAYWLLSEAFWFLYKIFTFVGAQLIWRTFDGLILIYLALNTSYWFLHAHFIGPTLGFLRSLLEEPEHIRQLPLKQRYKQRLILFAKKWGWLLLRGVRLR